MGRSWGRMNNMSLLGAADLSLGNTRPPFTPESNGAVPPTSSRHHDHLAVSCDLQALQFYHKALEDERLKIQVFQRELPFCMQLLDDAIEASREQLEERLTCKLNTPMHHELPSAATHEFVCNYTSSLMQKTSMPVVGEINLRFKRKWTSSTSPSSAQDHDAFSPYHASSSAFPTKWLLHQSTSSHPTKHVHEGSTNTIKRCLKLQESLVPDNAVPRVDDSQKPSLAMSSNTKTVVPNCISYHPTHSLRMQSAMQLSSPSFQETKSATYMLNQDPDQGVGQILADAVPSRSINAATTFDSNPSPTNTLSRSISISNLSPKELQMSPAMSSPLAKSSCHAGNIALQSGSGQRKPRRCWSPELHQRFLSALSHLGGCQVATPKQIRELMNVEGLTNDEVKSHLQKFRLHMRRPNSVLANSTGDSQQAAAHHLLVFGHIWVPPEYGEHHQHGTNINVNSVSDNSDRVCSLNDVADSDGALAPMKSFNNNGLIHKTNVIHGLYSCNNRITNIENAQVPILRLCQDEYCSDQELQQSKTPLHTPIRLLNASIKSLNGEDGGPIEDRNASAYPSSDRPSVVHQQACKDGDLHAHCNISHADEFAWQTERSMHHDLVAMKNNVASDQAGRGDKVQMRLLQLCAGHDTASMDDGELTAKADSIEINLSIGHDRRVAKIVQKVDHAKIHTLDCSAAGKINGSKEHHENKVDNMTRSREDSAGE